MTWTTRRRSERSGLAAIEAGSGARIVLLHGVGLRAEAWNRQIDVLAGSYHVTAFDMPGHGESAVRPEMTSVSDYADAVLGDLTEPALVVGHSMGAMIALDLASRAPELVRGVVALNAVFERSQEAARAVQRRAADLDGKSLADPSVALERWFGTGQSEERDTCRDWLCAVTPAGYKAAYTAFAHDPGPRRDALAALACPALFMTGALEPNSTPAMSHAMAALAPDGRSIIVDNAAHMMPMTHAEAVNAALLEFAEEVFA
ncbi:MAG: alpha/beta fold hydrolase [Pelagibaca sp.]